jgi:hypothetical protein
MKQLAAGNANQKTGADNRPPGAILQLRLSLARLGAGTCQLGQTVPAAKDATSNDHPAKDHKDKMKN